MNESSTDSESESVCDDSPQRHEDAVMAPSSPAVSNGEAMDEDQVTMLHISLPLQVRFRFDDDGVCYFLLLAGAPPGKMGLRFFYPPLNGKSGWATPPFLRLFGTQGLLAPPTPGPG